MRLLESFKENLLSEIGNTFATEGRVTSIRLGLIGKWASIICFGFLFWRRILFFATFLYTFRSRLSNCMSASRSIILLASFKECLLLAIGNTRWVSEAADAKSDLCDSCGCIVFISCNDACLCTLNADFALCLVSFMVMAFASLTFVFCILAFYSLVMSRSLRL